MPGQGCSLKANRNDDGILVVVLVLVLSGHESPEIVSFTYCNNARCLAAVNIVNISSAESLWLELLCSSQ